MWVLVVNDQNKLRKENEKLFAFKNMLILYFKDEKMVKF